MAVACHKARGLTLLTVALVALSLQARGQDSAAVGMGNTANGWRLAPIAVRGQRLYNSVTNQQFHSKGIGMPNLGDGIEEWIKVVRHIKELSPQINTVRIYVPPACALEGPCFEPFMRECDQLGIYVLVPGTGTVWGWLPGSEAACQPQTLDGCYKSGGVLAWGQKIVQHFNYPNTLAIVIGNEFEMQMLKYIPVLKAYARDLKAYMGMCNRLPQSPTVGDMRQIPLMYASSDDHGDIGVMPRADYLFCDKDLVSVDIFGLNVERWCEDNGGRGEYNKINKWVAERKYPGAFMFSEMGCSREGLPESYGNARTWNQVPNFFTNFPAIEGFVAYTYNGNNDFNMADGPSASANLLPDGQHFFAKVGQIGEEPQEQPQEAVVPQCPTKILDVEIGNWMDVHWYDTGMIGWAPSCPQPWRSLNGANTTIAAAVLGPIVV